MKLLLYNDLDISGITKQFEKVCKMLEEGDFKSAEIKKIASTQYYRAKLDYSNRLLFRFARMQAEPYILVLEVIRNHAYGKSRFLNGTIVDENKLVSIANIGEVDEQDFAALPYVNPRKRHFNLLDKILIFDDVQDAVTRMKTPLIIIGSAGSGKTVLSLEKLKMLHGDILYATLSQFLVENSI